MLGDGGDQRSFAQDALAARKRPCVVAGLWFPVIIIANAISLALLGGILFFKIRGPKSSHAAKNPNNRIVPARSS